MKPHKDSLKQQEYDHSKFYTVVIETNTPELVEFDKCDKVGMLLIDNRNLLDFIKAEGKVYYSPRAILKRLINSHR